jgi:coenzyme A diphosphatase NUDT7
LAGLERTLAARTRIKLERSRNAAVLLPLFGTECDLSLIFTRRADGIPMAGQVAFPGGRVEEGDSSRTETALREAREEVGLSPSAVRVIGLLDDLPTWDNRQAVSPVVGFCKDLRESQLVHDPAEVERVFSVPLTHLQEESRWVEKPMDWRGTTFPQYYFDVAAYTGETPGEAEALWGLSAYMVISLMSTLPENVGGFWTRHRDALRALRRRANRPA